MDNLRIRTSMKILFFLLILSFSIQVCATEVKEWTFMVFIAADNNLEGGAELDLMELEMVGSSDEVNFVVQIDRSGNYSGNTQFQWSGAKRYYVEKSSDPHTVTTKPLELLGDINMADPQTLIDFVVWSKENYPARRYALILWNHGTGWKAIRPNTTEAIQPASLSAPQWQPTPGMQAAMNNMTFNISYDEGSNSSMSIPDLHLTLAEIYDILGQKIDILGYDACLMQMAEVAWAAKPFARYQVGSPDLEPEYGWPYDMIARELVDNPYMQTVDLGKLIVDTYTRSYSGGSQGNTAVVLSLMDLSVLDDFSKEIKNFANAAKRSISEIDIIESARNASMKYSYGDYIDLGHFLKLIIKSDASSSLRSAATSLLSSITGSRRSKGLVRSVDFNGEKFEATTGISIFFPTREGFRIYQNPYKEMTFAQQTEWFSFLREIAQPNIPYLKLDDVLLEDQNRDGRIAAGEEITVYLTISNLGRQDISSAEIHCVTDSNYLDAQTFTSELIDLPNAQSQKLVRAFRFTVDQNTPIHTGINLRFTLRGNNIPDSTLSTTFHVREAFSSTGQALLILTDNFSPASPIIQEMMADAGIKFDIWDRLVDGDVRYEVLRRYIDGWVMVVAQDSTPEQSLNEEEISAIDEFLGIGGRLVLNGQDIAFCLRDSSFLEDRCKTEFIQDDVNIHVIRGINGFAENRTFNIFGGDGANNQKWPDEIDALPGAQMIFEYIQGSRDIADSRHMTGPNHKPGSLSRGIISTGGAGLRVVDGYRLILLGFGVEAVSTRAERKYVMQQIASQMQPSPTSEVRNLAHAATQRAVHRNISEQMLLERADLFNSVSNRLIKELQELEAEEPGSIQKTLNAIHSLPPTQRRLLSELEKKVRVLLDFDDHHGTLR